MDTRVQTEVGHLSGSRSNSLHFGEYVTQMNNDGRSKVMSGIGIEQCQIKVLIDVQWRDMDVLGHVNNAEYIRWFESARIATLGKIEMFNKEGRFKPGMKVGPILASVSCDFIAPVSFPETVAVGAHVTRIGRSSFNLAYLVVQSSDQKVVARGDSVVVQLDYETGRSEPLSEALRTKLDTLVIVSRD